MKKRLQNLDQLGTAVEVGGLDPASHRTLINRVRRHLTRYAGLERSLLGQVWVSVPSHLLELEFPSDPVEAAREVARRERERLRLGDEEVGNVVSLLDHEGLKVYRPPVPDRSPLEGIFLFDSEVGPAFVLSANLDPSSSEFVLARLYAHYLMDHDPYEIHLAVRGEQRRDPQTVRAEAFAASFLVSGDGVERYLREAGHAPGRPLSPQEVTQLGVFFEVGWRPLVSSLLLMGYLQSADIGPLLSTLPAPPIPLHAEEGAGPVSERFVRLALEAHARQILSMEELAEYLETDVKAARDLANRFQESCGPPDHSS